MVDAERNLTEQSGEIHVRIVDENAPTGRLLRKHILIVHLHALRNADLPQARAGN